ncbi:MAG: M48 family metalloprotease [Planctomycetales bacterium]|nr:M48 family metalloprotease [Planctomycetales bacterium]
MNSQPDRSDTGPPAHDVASLSAETMTVQQLAEAKAYGRQSLTTSLADRGLDLTFFAVLAFVVARPLDAWLRGFAWLEQITTLRLVVFFMITFMLHVLVSMGLSFYSGYVIEHRFGMSNQSRLGWLKSYLQRNALAATFELVMFVGLFWLIWLVGPSWWLAAAAAFFLVTILGGRLGPVLLLPLFYPSEKLEDSPLSERLRAIAEPAGLSIEGIYRLDMSAESNEANAMLAGMGRTRRVLLGTRILEEFSEEEILVVFGHEIGHHVFRHIHKMIFLGGLYGVVGLWLCDRAMAILAARGGHTFTYDNFPVWMLPMLMLLLTLFSQVFEPLWNAISRRFERQCDRYALEVTSNAAAYRSAFWKLARLNKDDPYPHPLDVLLFHSHPAIAERLAVAQPAE